MERESKRLIRRLRGDGWIHVATKGSHRQFKHPVKDAIKTALELKDWRRDADLALIPLLLDRGSSRRVNISLDHGLLELIDDEARRRRMTRSAFLATAARREIDAT